MVRELAARQDQAAKDILSTGESPSVSDSDADYDPDHLGQSVSDSDADYTPDYLGQSVGLLVWAVGVFEEIITHAIRSRVSRIINGKAQERRVYAAPVSFQRQASDRTDVTLYRQNGAGVYVALKPYVR